MANKKNVETNKKNTEIKNKKSNEIEQKKPTQKKKRRLHSHLKVNIPLFQSLMMILPSLAKHAAAESIDNSSDAADQVTANNVTEKDVTDDHNKADSSAVALQDAQTSDNDVNSTLSASHAAHGSSSHLVPSHHLSTLSHPQVHYIPSVSMPTISSGSNGQPTHSNAPTTPALPVTFMPEVIKGTYGELHVDANGQYTFVLNPNSPQYILLNQHQPGTDHFALHLSNGSSIIVQIPVTGKQDTPSISGDLTGVVTEDHNIDSQGLLHANGKIDVIDPDQNESSVTPEVISGKYGSLTIDADGHWQYQVDNSLSNVQALTAATSLHESFTIHTKDGTPQTIDMTIGGNDDNAVITGVDAGTLTEDLTTQIQGQLSVTDSDLGEDHFQASQVTSNFGTLSITKDGAWTYSLNNNNPVVQRLGQGSTATDIVTVHSADGTAHQVMVTINGTNDHAVITSSTANSPSSFFAIGTSNGSSQVTEDKDLTVSGQLNITDIDSKEAHFSNSDLKGTLGTLHLKDNGDWSYDLDNKNPKVQALGQGSATTDIITIHSADGTPHQIAITVNGTNDKAVISGTSTGVVTEESQLQTSGTLAVTDVDTGEAHFSNTDIVGSFGTLHLTDTGSWTYDLDNTNPNVQALGKGATATDTITVHSADGTPHQVTITVNGTNDAATVSSATVAIYETDKAVTTSGTLTSTDVDNPDNAFTPDSITGTNGNLTIGANGQWTFTANSAFNQLNVGDKVEETFTVSSIDGTPSTIKVTINGTNDTATVSTATVSVDETDKAVTTSGTLTSTDVDNPDNTFTPDSITGTNGDLTIDANGHWAFTANSAFNQLNVGDKVEETFTVSSVDGTPSTIKVTINGTNDTATVSSATVAIDETDKAVTTSGTLTSTDMDNPDNAFTPDSISGTNGDLTIDANGHWAFTANSAFNQLNVGDKVEETFTVTSVDGTPSTIKVTINGTNDAATVSSATVAIDETDKAVTTSGTLTSTDVDNPDNAFTPDSISGNNGDLTIDANGHWAFTANSAFNQLNVGDKVEETFTVSSVDGTPSTIKVTINGTNDAATVSSATVAIDETDKAATTSGTLTSTDVDNPDNAFTPDSISGTNGDLTIDVNGHWVFTANSAFNQLNVGDKVEETFTVSSVDGTPSTIKVTINGTNDTATVSSATIAIDETDKAVTTSGTLTSTDVDNTDNSFTPGSISGTNGDLTIDANGHWVFTANSTFNQLNVGDKVEETFTVSSIDGTASTIKVTINGTNDKATVSTATVSVDETDKAVTTSGTLTSTDVDNPDNAFTPDSITGTNGDLTIDASGHWAFTANSAFNQLNVGDKVEETFTVSSIDGTPSTIKVTINGTNDKAVISGTSTGVVTEESQLKASGSLTVTDVDAGQAHFSNTDIAGTLGTLHLTNSGTWTYDLDNTNPTVQALGKGTTATDTITVHSADGTPHQITITVNGTNDKAIIGGTNSGAVTEESQLQTSGTLTITDVDTGEAHFSNTDIVGNMGTLHLTDSGSWKYDLDNTNPNVQALSKGATATDTITVHSADGTPHQVTITVNGTNDTAVIGGTSAGAVTEETQLQTTGTLTITDTDGGEAHFANTDIQGSLGTLHLTDNGAWTYDLDNTNPAVQALGNGATATDTITVHSADGTPHHVTITVNGTNDNAVVGGVDTASVTEKAAGDNMSPDHAQSGMATLRVSTLNANGHLSVIDPDSGQSGFADNNVGYNYHGTYGDLILNPNGDWNYYADAGSLTHIGGRPTTRGSAIDKLGEGETLTDTITVHTKDGTPHNIVITINGSNDRPYCSSEVQLNAGTEDTRQTITAAQLLQNSIDVDKNDSGLLTVANLHPDHGSILDNQNGTYTFTPEKDYNGKVHFTYDVKDAHGGVTHTGATSSLSAVADKAVISGSDTGTIIEDHNVGHSSLQPVVASGLLSVTDPDAGQDHFQVNLLLGEQAIHDPFGGFLRITPSGAWGYEVANSRLQSLAEGEVEKVVYRVYSADHTAHDITITVTGTNDQPSITATTLAHGTEDTHYQMQSSQFGFNDIDTGDTLHSIAITDLPPATQGKFVLDGHDITAGQHIPTADISKLQFVPAQDFNGDVQFKYTVNDGHTDSAEATNTLHIDAVGDKAVISGVDTGDVYENRNPDMSPDFAQSGMAHLTNSMIHVEGQLTIIDPDTGENSFDSKGIGYTYHGNYGHLILNTDGKWFYGVATGTADVNGGLTTNVGSTIDQLGANETLTDTITIQSKDGTTHDIVITIHGDNDRPYCSSEVQLNSGKEDLAQTITATELLANTIDVDSNDLGKLTVANLHADHGSILDNQDGTYTFTPTKDYNGQVHFSYDVTDAHGGTTHTGAITTLAAVNDAATFTGDSGSIGEDTNIHHNAHITGSATIPDALSCHGHLIVSDADGHGEAALDLKGQPKISLDGTYGHFDITSTGTWVYKADNKSTSIQDLDNGQTLTDSIEVTSKDATKHSITVTINGTTDDPVLHSLSDSGVQHSGPVEGNLLTGSGTDQGLSGAATDTDSNAHLVLQDIQIKDPVSGYVAVRPGQPHTMAGIGTLAIEANGHYTFTPEAGFTGKVPSMVYRVGDDGGNPIGDSSQNSLSIEVTPPLQHAPTVTGQTVSTNEDITRTITTSEFGYSDQDGDALQFVTISSIPSHGLLLLNGNAVTANQQISKADLDAGHLTFTPNNNENGANYAQFTFTANDGHKNSAGATMVVDVNAVNDAPIVGSSFISSLEDKPHAFTTADFKYSDIDGDALNHITITNVAHGVLSLNGTTVNVGDDVSASDVSSLIFTPTHNYFSSGVSGLGGVQFTANDGHLDSKEGSILINIASVADPATFSGDSTGVAKEDITLQASGTLTASDPDGTAGFTAVQGGAGIAGSKGYGHAHIDVNGHWTYDLDNNHPIVQQLGEGQTDTETITVQSADGTHHDIVVTITGTNDAPILGVNQTSSTAGTLTETDVDVNDTHTFSIVSSTGQFGSLSVDPNTGDYVYTPNTSITGMSYNSATNSYHGVDVFEVKVSDGHTEDSKFITFDASGHVTMSPTGSLVTSTTVPHQPVVTATQPTLPSGTNVAPTNTVTLDLASTSDSGSSQTDNLTNDTTPTITGHTDIPFSKVTIYDGSTPVGHEVSDASGQYSVAVSSLSEGDHNLSAKALAPSSVLPATSSLLSVHIDTQVHVGIQTDPITADNVINAQESSSSIDITGSVSGDFNAGDIVTLDVNGTQHTGVVDAKGHYSIAVPGSELIADADQKIEASVAVTDSAGNSAHATADVTYQVDTQVSVPTITFENAGADNLYSKAEIARGQANTITATVTPPGDAKIGEHLVVNGQDHVLDAHTLQHGIQIEVHPGSNVQATMTDEHGNTAGSQGFAASAIPEPIIVRPPSGSHQVSGTLGVPPLLPSLTPVPTAQSGWRIHLPNGQYVTSHHGQYGTLTIDPQTGHLHYQEQAQVHTGPHGSASGIGQHEDKFEVALQGTNQDEVVAHVNIQILSHGPGNSGKLTVGTEVVDMTITPVVHTSHPAPPPPPPVQHDEPDMASQADFTVTLSDDSNLDLTQQTHQEPEQKTSHHGAAAYLDALGIKPDATSTTVHDQPADMDIVLAQVDQQDATTHDQAHLDMSDALEHHDANINHNQDDEHHHHNDIDGLPDIDPNS
nr:VCBS domain-containing protein [Vibrio lentus]PMH60608.1 toxin [Vibrio lentus]